MSDQRLQEISDQLYRDGIEKAELLAKEIIADAQDQARRIVKKARREENQILNDAKEEADTLHKQSQSDLERTAQHIILELKEKTVSLLLNTSLETSFNSLSDPKFLEEIILEITKGWSEQKNSLSFTFPKQLEDKINQGLATSLKESLAQNLQFRFDDSIDLGFEIHNHEEDYKLRFDEETFKNYFIQLLQHRTRKALFPTTT